jgi:hypothetical protein
MICTKCDRNWCGASGEEDDYLRSLQEEDIEKVIRVAYLSFSFLKTM